MAQPAFRVIHTTYVLKRRGKNVIDYLLRMSDTDKRSGLVEKGTGNI